MEEIFRESSRVEIEPALFPEDPRIPAVRRAIRCLEEVLTNPEELNKKLWGRIFFISSST